MKSERRTPRQVRGRRTVKVDGLDWRIELRADGLRLWRKGSRRKHNMIFAEVVDAALGQRRLL